MGGGAGGRQVVDAEYAFVLHTRNPVTGSPDEMMGEVVVGLGEALVGNYPGRALGFVVGKAAGAPPPAVARYPSKRTGIFLPAAGADGGGGGGTLIFRSDSNGEDLEGFAGAGLYDSVMATPAAERPVDYSEERLLFDDAFRADLLGRLAAAGRAVEAAMGGVPQDIEGAVRDGVVYIVQTRPQVCARGRGIRGIRRGVALVVLLDGGMQPTRSGGPGAVAGTRRVVEGLHVVQNHSRLGGGSPLPQPPPPTDLFGSVSQV